MRFREWLESSTIDDVIKAKGTRSKDIDRMSTEDRIWDAMWYFGREEVTSIGVFSAETNKTDFIQILTINDLLQHLVEYLKINDTVNLETFEKEFLQLPLCSFMTCKTEDSQPLFLGRETCLRKLIDTLAESQEYNLGNRIFVGDKDNIEDTVSVKDLVHYIFVCSHSIQDILQAHALPALYPGTKTPSPLSSSALVESSESAWTALKKLLDFCPFQVVGITDPSTGNLIGYLSATDFMPAENQQDIFPLVSNLKLSVAEFSRLICKTPTRLIDAFTFRDNMTLEQLIERFLKLGVDMLWRIAFTGQVIGVVTTYDLLNYFKRCSDLCY